MSNESPVLPDAVPSPGPAPATGDDRRFRYRALADALRAAMQDGRLPAGTRLPSVRQLCELHRASLSTVTHALHALEDAGLIEARPRLGFFVRPPVRPTAPSALASASATTPTPALALDERRRRLMTLAASPDDGLSLGHLALPASLLPITTLKRLLAQQLQRDPALLATGTVQGSEALRDQLAARDRALGCRVEAADVVVTTGQGESLGLCLRLLTRPGDVVLVGTPTPFRALELMANRGLQVLPLPVDADGTLSVEALGRLDALLSHQPVAACVLEPSLHQLGSARWSDGLKQALVALMTRHEVPLVECDMTADLHHGAWPSRPLKAFDTDDRVLYCRSLAGLTGPGFTLGHIASARYRVALRAARAVHAELLPQLMDEVFAQFLASEGWTRHVRQLRRQLQRQVLAHQQVLSDAFPTGTQVGIGPDGYALWVTLPNGADACELLTRARREGINFVPGAVFGLDRRHDASLRLTATQPMDAARRDGLRRLGALARALVAEGSPPLVAPLAASAD